MGLFKLFNKSVQSEPAATSAEQQQANAYAEEKAAQKAIRQRQLQEANSRLQAMQRQLA